MTTPTTGAPAPPSRTTRFSLSRLLLCIGIIAAIVALVIVGATQNWHWPWTDGDGSSDSDVPTLTDDMKRALTVADGDQLVCGDVDDNGIVSFKLETKEGVEPVGKRLWSDSLGLPVNGQDAVRGFKETEYAVWHGPDVGVTYAHFFAKLVVNDTKLVDLNPWLSDYNSDDAKINNQAASFILPKNPSDDDYKKFWQRNKDYQELACKVNTLLERFHVAGIDPNRPSSFSYRQQDGGLSIESEASDLPNIESTTDVDNRPAIVLELTSKTAGPCESPFAIGINVGDKRPELFTPKQPTSCETTSTTPGTQTTVSTTTPPGTQTTTTTPCCGTTTSTTTSTTSTTTTTTSTTTPPNTAKTTTTNSERPEGETSHPSPTNPETVAPTESHPAGTTPNVPTSTRTEVSIPPAETPAPSSEAPGTSVGEAPPVP